MTTTPDQDAMRLSERNKRALELATKIADREFAIPHYDAALTAAIEVSHALISFQAQAAALREAAQIVCDRAIASPEQWEECMKPADQRLLPGQPVVGLPFNVFENLRKALTSTTLGADLLAERDQLKDRVGALERQVTASEIMRTDAEAQLKGAEGQRRTEGNAAPVDLLDGARTAFADQPIEIINRIFLFVRFCVDAIGAHSRNPGYLETCGALVGLDKDEFCGVQPGERCPYDTPETCPIKENNG